MTPKKLHIACIIGTRPEVIKMVPVIQALRKVKHYEVTVVNTAQHRQLLDGMLAIFSLQPEVDLDLMQNNQTLVDLSGHIFLSLGKLFKKERFDLVIAQGDTTTSLIAAQIAFYNRIPYAHVEAGLRSYDMLHPFPEEMNRVFISKIATLHFAPTQSERKNLLSEGIPENNIIVTGNTVIDALLEIAKRDTQLPAGIDTSKRLILVTMHRRESFGKPIENVFKAFITLANTFPDIQIVYPVHPNPNVKQLAGRILQGHPNIKLIEPVPYDRFVALLKQAYLILTDSGGLQEEAPALNKPLLVLRDTTERPLVIELGLGKLVGTDPKKIVAIASELLTDPVAYREMQKNISPYGDGHASERIVNTIEAYFNYGITVS